MSESRIPLSLDLLSNSLSRLVDKYHRNLVTYRPGLVGTNKMLRYEIQRRLTDPREFVPSISVRVDVMYIFGKWEVTVTICYRPQPDNYSCSGPINYTTKKFDYVNEQDAITSINDIITTQCYGYL